MERSLTRLKRLSVPADEAIDKPRNATVRTLESCELLRPRQKPGVEAHHRTSSTGETITIFKDFERGALRETVGVIDG
jgi:hypothetical protein